MRHTSLALIDEEIEQEELSAEEYLVEQLAQVPSMSLKQLPSIVDLARVPQLDFPVGTPETLISSARMLEKVRKQIDT
jgi:hypothetical protein